MDKVLFSSNNMNFQTPENVLGLVRSVGKIELDPCTTSENPVGADRFYTPAEDGLACSWLADELVFVNPPYGKFLRAWIEKCAKEANSWGRIVALVPSRTDTIWFNRAMETADSVCFWKGRIHFIDPATGRPSEAWSKKEQRMKPARAPFPSAVFLWGGFDDQYRFQESFSKAGRVIDL